MKLFIVKLLAAFLFLGCILLAENILMGTLSMLGGLVWLSLCGTATLKLLEFSLRKPARRKHGGHKTAPALRVIQASQHGGGPEAA